MTGEYRKLLRPPINEVVCGFIFESPSLDVLDFGVYAERRAADFPKRELRPAIMDRMTLNAGFNSGLRAWLISDADGLLIQLQSDRFYVNWRRGSGGYPRFSSHGSEPGLKRRALDEFVRYCDFAAERSTHRPTLQRLELTKIDLLTRGEHYEDIRDLGEILRVAKVFEEIAVSDETQLRLQLSEDVDEGKLAVNITVDVQKARIETRFAFTPSAELEAGFDMANQRVNQVFFGLVDTARFGAE